MVRPLIALVRAFQRRRAPSTSSDESAPHPWIAATVRPVEAAERYAASHQAKARDLALRFVRHIKVAASRTATAVASTPLRVYRVAPPSPDRAAVRRRTILRASVEASGAALVEVTDPDHPLVRLLRAPNPRDSGYELLERLQLDLCLTGNHYWYLRRDASGAIVEIWPLDGQYTRPVPDRERLVRAYVYGRSRDLEQTFAPDDVIHFRAPNPTGDPWLGRGDLHACIEEADLSAAFARHALAFLDNGARPAQWIVPKPGTVITDHQRAQIEADLNRRAGIAHAGHVYIASAPIDVVPLTLSEREIAFLTSDKAVRETIANCFDLPVALLTLESAALATAAVALRHWQTISILPRCRRIEEMLNRRLAPQFGSDVRVSFDSPVSEDYAADAQWVLPAYTAGVISLNEARAVLSYDAVEGGDVIAPRAAPESPQTAMVQASMRPRRSRSGLPRHIRATEAELDRALREAFAAVWPSLADVVAHRAETDVGGIAALVADYDALRDHLRRATHRPLARLVLQGWRDAMREAERARAIDPVAITEALASAPAQYLRQRQTSMITTVSRTLGERIRASLAEGVERGEGVKELTERVLALRADYQTWAAERIARTETAAAYVSSKRHAWGLLGIARWRWDLSTAPCEICRARAADLARRYPRGVPVDGDEEAPPMHPNCNCSIIAVIE